LVQEQRPLSDGSALRLTVARYYIPSGRCIQKPYDQGKEKYYQDIVTRLRHGELDQKDSIHFDENLKFKTIGGRTVYGGGGVMPDIFVPIDTIGITEYWVKINNPNTPLLYDYTFEFMDNHRDKMKNITDYKQLLNYLQSIDLVNEMADYAAKRGVKRDPKGIKKSYKTIIHSIKSYIGRHVLDNEGFYPIFFMNDKTIQEAIKK
jgi:carboxyl-terminal processing protease